VPHHHLVLQHQQRALLTIHFHLLLQHQQLQPQCQDHQEQEIIHLVAVVADHVHLLDQLDLVKLEELQENYNQDNDHQCLALDLALFAQVLQHVLPLVINVHTLVHQHHLVQALHHLHTAHLHLLQVVHHLVARVVDVHHKEVAQLVRLEKAEKEKIKTADRKVKKKDVKILKICLRHN
jgi:hypothetical protein